MYISRYILNTYRYPKFFGGNQDDVLKEFERQFPPFSGRKIPSELHENHCRSLIGIVSPQPLCITYPKIKHM